MTKPFEVTDQTFDEKVIKAERPVLVDFWAAWCGPCRMVAPVVESLADEYSEQLDVAKLDVDANQNVAMELGISSIPTLMLYKEGKPVERIVGYLPKERLVTKIKPHLS